MAVAISQETLRDLAAFRARRGCAISVFLDLDPAAAPTVPEVAARIRATLHGVRREPDGLDHGRRLGIRADLERLERFFDVEFDRGGASGYAVFVDGPDDVWIELPLIAPVPDGALVGEEFHLAPLVPHLGHGEGALVVVVSRERGSIYRLHDGRLTELADLTEDAPRRHDQGGWSQSKLQRWVDRVAQQHYGRVADELGRRFRALGRPRIVGVAGDEARAGFDDALEADVAGAIVGWAQAEAHATARDLAAVVEPVLERWRRDSELETVERWRAQLARGEAATADWADTLAAASDGRVDVLLYADGAEHEAVRCPGCGRVEAEGTTCPLDGEPFEPTGAGFDLAVRQTLGYGGTLRQVRSHPGLDAAGGIGALLRF